MSIIDVYINIRIKNEAETLFSHEIHWESNLPPRGHHFMPWGHLFMPRGHCLATKGHLFVPWGQLFALLIHLLHLN